MYTSIFDILLFQCQKMGNFQFFIDFLPVFSEGRGPKNVLKKKSLKNIPKTFLITKNHVLGIKTMFQPFYRQFQHIWVSRFISISLMFFENPKICPSRKRGNIRPCKEVIKNTSDMNHLGLLEAFRTKTQMLIFFPPLPLLQPGLELSIKIFQILPVITKKLGNPPFLLIPPLWPSPPL